RSLWNRPQPRSRSRCRCRRRGGTLAEGSRPASLSSVGRLPWRCERIHDPRWPNASRLDLLEAAYPRLAAIRGAVGGPGKAILLYVRVSDSPSRRLFAHHAKPLLNVHLRTDALAGADILQSVARVHPDELPSVEDGIVGAHGRGDVVRLVFVADDPILVQNLTFREAHGAPISARLSILTIHCCELPIAEQVIEVSPMCLVGCPDLLRRFRGSGLRGKR